MDSHAVYIERSGVFTLVFHGTAPNAARLADTLARLLHGSELCVLYDDGQDRRVCTTAADGTIHVTRRGPSSFNSRRESVGVVQRRLLHSIDPR